MVEANLAGALRAGNLKTGTAKLLTAEAPATNTITISMPLADLERTRRLAERKGRLPDIYQASAIKLLLRDAFDREEASYPRKSARNMA